MVGYYPGVIGEITRLHAVYYAENWGFDKTFEIQVGRELSGFVERFDPRRDGLWVNLQGEKFAGSIVIDGNFEAKEGARLRWFIVDPAYHGKGIGRELIRQAMAFCRRAAFPGCFYGPLKGLVRIPLKLTTHSGGL